MTGEFKPDLLVYEAEMGIKNSRCAIRTVMCECTWLSQLVSMSTSRCHIRNLEFWLWLSYTIYQLQMTLCHIAVMKIGGSSVQQSKSFSEMADYITSWSPMNTAAS